MILRNFSKIKRDNRLFRALTGMSVQQFNILLDKFSLVYEKDRQNNLNYPKLGRKHVLKETSKKLFYILFYMKAYPTFDVASCIFDVDRASVCRWSHDLLLILEKTLGKSMCLPARKMTSLKDLFKLYPKLKTLLIDVSERPIRRPQDKKKQKEKYSGKKKRHTCKNTIISTTKKEIIYMSDSSPGKEHDYTMFKNEKVADAIKKKMKVIVDKGYQGIKKDYSSLEILIPKKKPKGKDLSQAEKTENKHISKERISVEHSIGGFKRYGIATNIARMINPLFRDKTTFVAAGLWNYYLK